MRYHSLESKLQEAIYAILIDKYGYDVGGSGEIAIQPTKKEFEGDYTFVVFTILKGVKGNPEAIGKEIGVELLEKYPKIVSDFNVVKGFLNLSLNSQLLAEHLLLAMSDRHFGHQEVHEHAPLYMVEYSSPNTNKPLHLGHIRNNLLGYSLATILEANGYRVVKTNIVNDRGIHICKSMLAWLKWGNGETPESTGKKGDHLIGDYYVLFDKHYKAELKELMEQKGLSEAEAEKQSALMKEAREMLQAWEANDPEVKSLWQTMNNWVYEGFDETYKQMGVDFDKIYYESDTYLVGRDEVLRGLKEGIFYREADNSVWVDLTNEGYDKKILLRADGTSVYITQDIGTAKMRYEDYPIDHMVYVVGNEQEYHFQILSLILDKLGFAFGKDLKHFSYGMVELPTGKMKSREGTVVDADDLMESMIEEAYSVSNDLGKVKEMPEEEKREVAQKVGLGALKYFLLKVDPKKNMLFDPEESIDFNGNTGPFIQYTYARIKSVLRKGEEQGLALNDEIEVSGLALSEKEKAVIIRLNDYPAIVRQAADIFSPALVANYAYELSREFNQFYHDHSILNESDEKSRDFRILLAKMTSIVLSKAMGLLGIEMPEAM